MARLAAIDIGSTSVHLLVADVVAGVVRPVADESAFAGLGEVVATDGRLGAARSGELARLLGDYVRGATDLGAERVLVVATAPLRRAADGTRVVRQLEGDPGAAVHVLSEREEALLTLLGATRGAVPGDGILLVDVGGGSTEIVVAGPGRRLVVEAVPLGAATLGGRHGSADPPLAEELAAMREAARAGVAGLPAASSGSVLAVGGTADNLARVAGGTDLTRPTIERAVERLTTMSAEEAATAFGLRVARARLLPAGAAILLAAMRRMGIDALTVAPAGLREGAILGLAASGAGWRDRLEVLAAGPAGDARSPAPAPAAPVPPPR